jgi:RNA polymerase sigma-70 factor, ECF subfamily
MAETGLITDEMVAIEGAGTIDMAVNESAFELESAVRDHARFLFGVAYSVLRNIADAEDVVQETFLRAHRSSTSTEVREGKAWLARITWRLACDRAKRTREAPLDNIESSGFELPSHEPQLDDELARKQRTELLHRLIATLPDDLRETLLLSTVKEMNSAEIGAVLGIPETSVRTRLFRARQMLKEKLQSLMERNRHGS